MNWNYRIIDFGTHKALHEVYYDDEGQPSTWTERAVDFVCDADEGPEEIARALSMALSLRASVKIWPYVIATMKRSKRSGRWTAFAQATRHWEWCPPLKGKLRRSSARIGLDVLRELYRMVDFKTGRLDPSIATIMSRIKRSRAAVVRALARLKFHGFLNWIRRTEPTDNEGQGPQVRQITNAYWFGLPKRAADWVKRVMGAAPPPDDDVTRRAAEAAELEEMIESLPMRERMAARVDDPHLAKILARMGEGIEGLSASSPRGQNPA